MSVWVLTQVAECEEIVLLPTQVLGVYRNFADAQKGMKQMIEKLTKQGWTEVPDDQAKLLRSLPNPYCGMKLEEIVRTIMTDDGDVCAIQLTCLPIQ